MVTYLTKIGIIFSKYLSLLKISLEIFLYKIRVAGEKVKEHKV